MKISKYIHNVEGEVITLRNYNLIFLTEKERNSYSSGQNIVPISRATFQQLCNGSLMVKSLTNSSVERILKRLYGNFSKWLYFIFACTSAAIGIGIPLDSHATSASSHQSTEQLPVGFQFLFLPSCHWKYSRRQNNVPVFNTVVL